MARPTRLTNVIQETLVEAFTLGNISIDTAAHYAGIAPSTYYNWMKRGREAKKGDERYVEFMEAIEKARAEAIMVNLVIIRRAAQEGNWQAAAWWLERVMPRVYGRKQQIEVVTIDAIEAEIKRLEAELDEPGTRKALPAP